MTSMRDHVRDWLGRPIRLRKVNLGTRGIIDLVRVDNAPCEGATTIATDGLRELVDHPLNEELVMACWADGPVEQLSLVLEFIARQLADGRDALLYGDVLGPAGPLVPGTAMDAIYVCEPTYYPPGFAKFTSGQRREIRTRWLVPIYHEEAHLVVERGRQTFEDLLAQRDPDLLTLDRPSVALQ
jgi:hypothetical protein